MDYYEDIARADYGAAVDNHNQDQLRQLARMDSVVAGYNRHGLGRPRVLRLANCDWRPSA